MTQIWCIAVSMQYAQIMGNVPYVMSTVNGMEVIQYTKNDFTHLNSLWSLLDVVVVVVIVPVLWRESECWCVGVAGRGHAGVTQWPEINGAQLFSNVNNTISSPEYEYRFLEKVLKRFLIWEKRERIRRRRRRSEINVRGQVWDGRRSGRRIRCQWWPAGV